MHWRKLTGTDGRSYHVSVDHIAYIVADEPGVSWVHFAGRGNHASIGAIAVRSTPEEILNTKPAP
jgi:hypothetical protein